jgi:hypothetical protein
MNRRSASVFIALMFLLTAYSVPAQQTAGNANVRARIVDGLTGQAVERVRFTLSGPGLVDPMTGNTDVQGELSLSGISAGRYRLTLEKAGYFPELSDLNLSGSSLTLPDIVLTPKREITGIVRWQDGEVVARAQVRVFGIRGGKPVYREDIPSVATNVRGEFNLANLRPGRYILLVSPPTQLSGLDFSGQLVPGGIPRLGLPVFYPGGSVPDLRSTLDLRGVPSAPNVAIVLDETPGVVVEGSVIPSATTPAGSNVSIALSGAGLFSASVVARVGEPFRIAPVPAGIYVLDAIGQGSQPTRTFLSVTVGGNPVLGVTVTMPPPSALSGRVEVDDSALHPIVNIQLRSEKVQGTLSTTSSPDGEFRIPLTVEGELYGLIVGSLPPNMYLAAVFQGERQIPASPFQVTAGGDVVRIVLKSDGGTIEGTVKEDDRVASSFVVLAPKDRRLEQNFRTVVADREGTFKLSDIAPGDYDLYAFDRDEDDDYLDDVFLGEFADRGVETVVEPGSTRSVELKLIRLPRP